MAVLAGCAGVATTPDEASLRTLIQPVEVRLFIPRAELFVLHEPSTPRILAQNGMCAFGYIACMASAGVAPLIEAPFIEAGNALAAPLQDAVADVPFIRRFEEAYASGLTAHDVRHEMVVMPASATDWDKLEAFTQSDAGSVMFAAVWYYLAADFSSIQLQMRVEVFARADAARRKLGQKGELADDPVRGPVLSQLNALYWTDFRYEARLPSPDKQAALNAEEWRRDDAARVRAAVLGAIEQATRVMSRDFGSRLWQKEPELPKARTREGSYARLIEEIPGQGRLLRLSNGSLLFEATLPEVATATSSPM